MSNVHASDRKESRMEYVENINDIYRETCRLIEADYGLRKNKYTLELAAKNNVLTEDMKTQINNELERLNIDPVNVSIIKRYPKFFIKKEKEYLYDKVTELADTVNIIQKHYPSTIYNFCISLIYLRKAITICICIENRFKRLCTINGMSFDPFKQLLKLVNKELKLLEGVEKSCIKLHPEYYSAIKNLCKKDTMTDGEYRFLYFLLDEYAKINTVSLPLDLNEETTTDKTNL